MMIWRSLDNGLLVKVLRSIMAPPPGANTKPETQPQPNPPKSPAQ